MSNTSMATTSTITTAAVTTKPLSWQNKLRDEHGRFVASTTATA
jgi:hypothetical protein